MKTLRPGDRVKYVGGEAQQESNGKMRKMTGVFYALVPHRRRYAFISWDNPAQQSIFGGVAPLKYLQVQTAASVEKPSMRPVKVNAPRRLPSS